MRDTDLAILAEAWLHGSASDIEDLRERPMGCEGAQQLRLGDTESIGEEGRFSAGKL